MAHDPRFDRAFEIIDDLNRRDPTVIEIGGESVPRELAHSRLMTDWVLRLQPDASAELLLAARAHHLRRWEIPRDSEPAGRSGYLRWRAGLHEFHAAEAARALAEAGYDEGTAERVGQIIRKHDLRRDPEVQVLEDALCLVFLETGFAALRAKQGDEQTAEILRKTLKKMSPAGQRHALQLDLPAADRAFLTEIAGD
ncbi:MAG: DUF4202 domain-containing protein [Chloroflexota bacterium]|jgi:hypothetical protein|nr:DUF4202 domain-containing protein [Chloroflexota bacterium]MDP6509154.1 DUF4202 domain-containing protein [Chloroflexota bacterium]MDP6757929.1 DUF4202 domain-containing protein [Chloroflexota bacterium]